MSHGKLREEKNCLNCGHIVEDKFCPNCGQENTESKKPFHYLFTHFIEDFTHYDGQFWGTIKNLLFKPGKLTNIYLEGKRQQFVPPVKLYIFISFLTFFLFAMFPPFNFDFSGENILKYSIDEEILDQPKVADIQKKIDSIKAQPNLEPEDSIAIENFTGLIKDSASINNFSKSLEMNKGIDENIGYNGYNNRKSYDSAVAKKTSSFDFINVPFAHKYFELKEKGVKKRRYFKKFSRKLIESFTKSTFYLFATFCILFLDFSQ